MKKNHNKTIILDTETTGIDEARQCLQLAIIDERGKPLFNEYFKPVKIRSWKDAEAVNHISPDMVSQCKHFKSHLKEIQEIINGAASIIGYNVNFDIETLVLEGVIIPDHISLIDLMPQFAEIYGDYNEYFQNYKWQKLGTAAHYYNYCWTSAAHDAAADAQATLFIYKQMQQHGQISFDEIPETYDSILKAFNEKIGYHNTWHSLWEFLGYIDHPGKNVKMADAITDFIKSMDAAGDIKAAPYCLQSVYSRLLFVYNLKQHPRAKNKYTFKGKELKEN